MVPKEYGIAYKEVLEILKHVSKEDVSKIPNNMLEMMKINASEETNFSYDVTKTLTEQNVSETARVIISILFRDYWATSEQREKIINKEKCAAQVKNDSSREQYNPDNIFEKQDSQSNDCTQQTVAMVEYKESIIKRFIAALRRLFVKK